MKEEFLHYVWQWRRFDSTDLHTTDFEAIQILTPGQLSPHAGPDFFNARVRVGDTEWAGNVEIHINASDWYRHGHEADPAYDNVILHVVWLADAELHRSTGERVPCLELRQRVPPDLIQAWRRLMDTPRDIPCAEQFLHTPPIVQLNWLDRLLVERLEQKTTALEALLADSRQHWEEVFYFSLARSFGLAINAEPFEALARSLPLSILAKHKTDHFQLEALIFGQAGLLESDFNDEYPRQLAREYRHLRHKYGLTPLPSGQWKFLRLRPAAFPTVRLAQFAALVHRSAHLFSKVLEAQTIRELEHLFTAEAGDYWTAHYVFDKTSHRRSKALGRDFIQLIAINTIIPAMFLYGRAKKLPDFESRALRLLEELPPESNSVVDRWIDLGFKPRHAAHSQALLQLSKHWCAHKRCLQCAIGHYGLR